MLKKLVDMAAQSFLASEDTISGAVQSGGSVPFIRCGALLQYDSIVGSVPSAVRYLFQYLAFSRVPVTRTIAVRTTRH